MLFICYPKCSTCQKAKQWLLDREIPLEIRDIKTETPSLQELISYYKQSGLPLKRFFNTSGLKYKELGLTEKLPQMTEQQQLELLSTDGMLIKRPILVSDQFVLLGFKEKEWAQQMDIPNLG